jgi:carboxylesterase
MTIGNLSTSTSLLAFQGPEHLPFLWPGGAPAALLVHGFPGTPAEIRPLGEALHKAGWTVQGLLLPGFGPQIATLDERRAGDWAAAVEEALCALKRDHSPVLLVGYSMGAALAIGAAARAVPDGLVLLAPFWWTGSPLQRALGALLRPLLPRSFRPLRRADFANPQLRRFVANFFPQADLDNPQTQEDLRQIDVPLSIVNQVRITGRTAYDQAPGVETPLLIVQGKHDEIVRPQFTRRLMKRLPHSPRYLEVDADHDLVRPAHTDWPAIEQAVLDFAASLPHAAGIEPKPEEDSHAT